MKKTYQAPSITTTQIALTQMIAGSITDVDGGDSGISYGGGGSGGARGRERRSWDDDWDD